MQKKNVCKFLLKMIISYELNADNFTATHSNFGCQSDWPDMARYARKLNVSVAYNRENLVVILANGVEIYGSNLQQQLYEICVRDDLQQARNMSIRIILLSRKYQLESITLNFCTIGK